MVVSCPSIDMANQTLIHVKQPNYRAAHVSRPFFDCCIKQ